jgi:hypothetical protein
LGKGSSLFQSLLWFEETNSKLTSANIARHLYGDILLRIFGDNIRNVFTTLPICFPTNCGGLFAPVLEWTEIKVKFDFELRFFWWLCQQPPNLFLGVMIRLREVNSRVRRKMSAPRLSTLLGGFLSDQGILDEFDPNNLEGCFSFNSVQRYFASSVADVVISDFTGLPEVHTMVEQCKRTFGFYPIEALLDALERLSVFQRAFSEGFVTQKKKSFYSYCRDLKRVYNDIRSSYVPVEPGYPDHGFKSILDLSWNIRKGYMTFIHVDNIRFKTLAAGPTLSCDLGHLDVVKSATNNWPMLLEECILHYIEELGDPDTLHG